MKRAGALWEPVTGFGNLLCAYHKARLGKRGRADVAAFALELEPALFALQRELRAGAWQPGPYRQISIYERKPRLVSVAPFRDRVVHHALMNHLAPVLDARFLYDSYACRPGKGVHAAVARYQRWAGRYADVMQLDLRGYFASIEHAALMRQLGLCVKERPLLDVLERLIDSFHTAGCPGRGLPIGNLTSQWFANLYLDALDHWIKQGLKVPAYLRYVDDLVLLADDKAFLQQARRAIGRRERRVNRGGSWNNNPARVRSANRNRNTPSNRNNNLGFRLAESTSACRSAAAHGPAQRAAGVHGARPDRARRRGRIAVSGKTPTPPVGFAVERGVGIRNVPCESGAAAFPAQMGQVRALSTIGVDFALPSL